MNYNEWRDELKSNLLCVSENERRRVLDYYAEAYADRREAGFSEKEIIDDFGAPYDAAQRILADNKSEAFYGEDVPRGRREKKRESAPPPPPACGQFQQRRLDCRTALRNILRTAVRACCIRGGRCVQHIFSARVLCGRGRSRDWRRHSVRRYGRFVLRALRMRCGNNTSGHRHNSLPSLPQTYKNRRKLMQKSLFMD